MIDPSASSDVRVHRRSKKENGVKHDEASGDMPRKRHKKHHTDEPRGRRRHVAAVEPAVAAVEPAVLVHRNPSLGMNDSLGHPAPASQAPTESPPTPTICDIGRWGGHACASGLQPDLAGLGADIVDVAAADSNAAASWGGASTVAVLETYNVVGGAAETMCDAVSNSQIVLDGAAAQAKPNYRVSDEDRAMVEAAEMPTDIEVGVRNKLYNAMSRIFKQAERDRIYIPPAVVCKYKEAQLVRGNFLCV
jgi:hypothetical protein